jgi:hypothetical protein
VLKNRDAVGIVEDVLSSLVPVQHFGVVHVFAHSDDHGRPTHDHPTGQCEEHFGFVLAWGRGGLIECEDAEVPLERSHDQLPSARGDKREDQVAFLH